MAEQKINIVRSVLIPLQGISLLLPNVAIAEVVSYSAPAPLAKAPDWVKGLIAWRGQRVPLLTFERLMGYPGPAITMMSRIAILNRWNTESAFDFVGLVIQGIPRLSRITANDIQVNTASSVPQNTLCAVMLAGETNATFIPDLSRLDKQLQATIKY